MWSGMGVWLGGSQSAAWLLSAGGLTGGQAALSPPPSDDI